MILLVQKEQILSCDGAFRWFKRVWLEIQEVIGKLVRHNCQFVVKRMTPKSYS